MSEAGKQIIRSRTKSFRDIYVAPVTQNDATAYAAGTPVKLARAISGKVSDKFSVEFEYHTFLHHSQTSNSKMKCHHSHKIQVLKLLGCYISHPSLSIIYLVTPSMQSLAQVSINKS